MRLPREHISVFILSRIDQNDQYFYRFDRRNLRNECSDFSVSALLAIELATIFLSNRKENKEVKFENKTVIINLST